MSQVDVLLTVGKLDASLALLTTEDHHVIEFPTVLLPDDVKAGSIVKLSVSQTLEEERKQRDLFREIQAKILEKYGTHKPKPPVLKIVNVTQTSCVLAWDQLELGSSCLKSLVLYRQGVRSTVIPCPLKSNTTKISGLSVDTDYEFELKLTTTSGQLWSEKVKMHTHKMTDMSGITVCLGPLDPLLNISGAQIAQSLSQIGARPLQRRVAIDTTHFVTNDAENDDDPELMKAKNSNIPIVRPEWVRASEMERRIVGVRGFYLDADQGILKSYQFPPATDEFKAKFAKLKSGETTDSVNLEKKLPTIDGSQPAPKEDDVEDVGLTEEDLNVTSDQPVNGAGEEEVYQKQEGEKSHSKELTDSEVQEGIENGEPSKLEQMESKTEEPVKSKQPVTNEQAGANDELVAEESITKELPAEQKQANVELQDEGQKPVESEQITETTEPFIEAPVTTEKAAEPPSVEPVKDFQEEVPAEPEQPVEQEQQTELQQAAEPVQPVEEEQQTKLEQATEPEQQAERTEERQPIEEEQPTEKEQPLEKEQPVDSEQPAESGSPFEAEQPTEKEQPAESEPPLETEQPTEKEQPAESEPPLETEQPIKKEQPSDARQSDKKLDETDDQPAEAEQLADVNNPLEPAEPVSESTSEPTAEPSAPRSSKKNKKKKNKKK